MQTDPIPLVILAGSDRQAVRLPESGAGLHPLTGYKGLDLKISGTPLIDLVIKQIQLSGRFAPLYITGPKHIYGESRNGVKVIDTDLDFGKNIEQAVSTIVTEKGHGPIALIAGDILPDLDELKHLMEDYDQFSPMDFWFPLIRVPKKKEQMGASSWKPKYHIAAVRGEPAKTILPGHLIIVDSAAVRLSLVYKVLALTYKSRNHPILYRLTYIVSHMLVYLLGQDFRLLLKGRLPTYTLGILYNSIALAVNLRRGVSSSEELSSRLRKIFILYRHRQKHRERLGRMPLMHGFSFARDIDTEEEAREIDQESEFNSKTPHVVAK